MDSYGNRRFYEVNDKKTVDLMIKIRKCNKILAPIAVKILFLKKKDCSGKREIAPKK